jgi:O-antigen/teichoic acid export membrane protein
MSRSRRFVGGLVLTYGYQALLMITGLWLTPFLLRSIGQHDYGLWLVGNQLLLYLTLADFGIVALLPIETAQATGRSGGAENAHDLAYIVGETTRLVLYQLPIVGVIAFVLWLTIPAEWYGLRWPLAVALGGYVLCFPLRILPALLHGLQDLTFVSGMQIATWAINTSLIVLLVLAGWNLFALAVGWTVSQLVLTPVFAHRLWTRFPQVVPRRIPSLAWRSAKEHLGKGFWVSVAQVAQLLIANTDLLIIGRLLGPAAVVPYSCTGKLTSVAGNQVNILMQNAGPGLCELRAAGSPQRTYVALSALTQGVLTFSGLIFCIVLLVNHWFVNWWVTAHQYGGFVLTLLFAAMLVARHWTGITANTVFYFGYQRRISLTNLADGFVTVTSTLVLVRILGVGGAVLGSMAGACLVSLPLNLWIIARDVGVNVSSIIKGMVGAWFWRFALVAGVVGCVALRWSPKNLVEGVSAVLAVSVLYLAMMAPNLMRAPLINYVRPLLDSVRARFAPPQVRVSL